MTRALIVVESYFGNTRAIAEAVAAGLIEGGVDAQVVDVSQAPSALPADLDLLVLGAPTHNRGLPTAATRAKACAQAGSGKASHGIGGWLETTAIPASTGAAAFDTVISKGWLSGSAAKAIAKTSVVIWCSPKPRARVPSCGRRSSLRQPADPCSP